MLLSLRQICSVAFKTRGSAFYLGVSALELGVFMLIQGVPVPRRLFVALRCVVVCLCRSAVAIREVTWHRIQRMGRQETLQRSGPACGNVTRADERLLSRGPLHPACLRQIPTGKRVLERIVIRVLHVDDEMAIRLLVRVNLEDEGMEVIEAANGRTGVQLAKREQPDLILLGVMMPVLDGWQAAEELAKDQETHEIPIVFLTAQAELRHCVRGFDLGAVDYIFKPFDPTELAPRIRRLLERLKRSERDELRREKFSEVRALALERRYS